MIEQETGQTYLGQKRRTFCSAFRLAETFSAGCQWQPQERGVHPQLPAEAGEAFADDLAPLAGAAKTESWIVCFALSHFGHVIACVWLITMRS